MRNDQVKYLESLALLLERLGETGGAVNAACCGQIAVELRKLLACSEGEALEELEDWYERVGKGK